MGEAEIIPPPEETNGRGNRKNLAHSSLEKKSC
jgi:hypothetical protein